MITQMLPYFFLVLYVFSMDNFSTYNYGQTKLEANVQTIHFNILKLGNFGKLDEHFFTFEQWKFLFIISKNSPFVPSKQPSNELYNLYHQTKLSFEQIR